MDTLLEEKFTQQLVLSFLPTQNYNVPASKAFPNPLPSCFKMAVLFSIFVLLKKKQSKGLKALLKLKLPLAKRKKFERTSP